MRSLSQIKGNILKLLWDIESPVNLREISEKTGLENRSANMHLLGLKRAGYVSALEGGRYTITELGREILGFPKVDENMARRVLTKTSMDRAFHFYTGIGQRLEVHSDNLVDFCDKIKTVDIESVQFHATRGDFELWVHFLGDIELAKRLRLLREANLSGETLRERLCKTLKSRCDELLRKIA